MARKLSRRRTSRGWRMAQSEGFQRFLHYPVSTTVRAARRGVKAVRRRVSRRRSSVRKST